MDTAILAERLKEMFLEEAANGLVVDAFGLALAYKGFITNSYVLSVSGPSMINEDGYDKMDLIIDLLHAKLSPDERGMIDRVQVYNSVKELKKHAKNDFDRSFCNVEDAELYEIA